MRSLRDFLLEQTVLNFGEIFSKEKQNMSFKVGNETLSGIYLPPSVFDKILAKSREMCWRILPEDLFPCVENMNKLQWEDLCYFTDRVLLRTKDVSFICKKKPTMKSLSVHIMYSDPMEVSDCLSEVARSLENLELSLACESQDHSIEIPPGDSSKFPIFRLKRLSLNKELNDLPLRIDPESLERLDLREIYLTDISLGLMETYKNLRHLNLSHVIGKNGFEVVRALGALKQIRTIIVTKPNWCYFTAKALFNFISVGEYSLQILGIFSLNMSLWKTDFLPKRNFKDFGSNNFNQEKVMNPSSLCEILSLPERVQLKHESDCVTVHLGNSLLCAGGYKDNDMREIEELLLKCLDYEMHFATLRIIKYILDNVDIKKFSTDFKIKLMSRMCSLAPIGDIAMNRCMKIPVENQHLNAFLLDFIEKNPHKQLTKKISKSFELYPEAFEGKKQVVLIVELSRLSRYNFE